MSDAWPALPYDAWRATCTTLHMWTQIVGKVRLALAPHVNHWWQVPLYVGARGLTTTAIPYGDSSFEMEFDFIDHVLAIRTCDGESRIVKLEPKSVAAFHAEVMAALESLGLAVRIWTVPQEVDDPIPFDKDTVHAAYEREPVERFWRVTRSVDAVLKQFRGGFVGKVSPVHFFWGSFDLCVTRFSGRRAPPMPKADKVTQEAYSHEVISVGWWPGDPTTSNPAFYAYASPEPAGFGDARVLPAAAFYDRDAGQFRLKYEDVRTAASPRQALLDFCQSTYEAAATRANWTRAELER
ncbi:MAG: hypothetical protein J0J01_08425 [Reyranella sp.]|uniref:DUF5996 family protein n=1 Tax=Reyranella sp. TaxID=1929291 RepID=UPI001AC1E9B9|nr:DUF5996 family protein [Reyranella sp.]MBN9086917.1 hypothetical protein [Reyranella sp.]